LNSIVDFSTLPSLTSLSWIREAVSIAGVPRIGNTFPFKIGQHLRSLYVYNEPIIATNDAVNILTTPHDLEYMRLEICLNSHFLTPNEIGALDVAWRKVGKTLRYTSLLLHLCPAHTGFIAYLENVVILYIAFFNIFPYKNHPSRLQCRNYLCSLENKETHSSALRVYRVNGINILEEEEEKDLSDGMKQSYISKFESGSTKKYIYHSSCKTLA